MTTLNELTIGLRRDIGVEWRWRFQAVLFSHWPILAILALAGERNRLDLIIINNRFGEFYKWVFSNPRIAARLTDYRLYTSDKRKEGDIFLYARSDLVALRPAVDEAVAASSSR